jgi:hypothetical protein
MSSRDSALDWLLCWPVIRRVVLRRASASERATPSLIAETLEGCQALAPAAVRIENDSSIGLAWHQVQ